MYNGATGSLQKVNALLNKNAPLAVLQSQAS
jgi:hypothetical protein